MYIGEAVDMDIADSDDDEEKRGWRVERMDTTSGIEKPSREHVRLYKTSLFFVIFLYIIHFNLIELSVSFCLSSARISCSYFCGGDNRLLSSK